MQKKCASSANATRPALTPPWRFSARRAAPPTTFSSSSPNSSRPLQRNPRSPAQRAGACPLCLSASRARQAEVTSRCAIAFGTSLPGVFGWLPGGGGLPGCGAVGYRGADRGDGLGQVFAAAGPALQGPPVLAVGDGVFDADPCR